MKRFLQLLFSRFLFEPVIPEGKSVGYSLVRSELSFVYRGKNTAIHYPCRLLHVSIGDYSYIARGSDASHCSIGKFCSIGPNFCCGLGAHPTDCVSTAPMFYSSAKQNGISLCSNSVFEEFKQTEIGNDVFIGANVIVLDGVKIGDGAVIGAGAVVTNDIPPYAVAAGVPAKVIKYRFDKETMKALLASEWWNKSDLNTVREHFDNVDAFLASNGYSDR